ncbi:hypothetical protein [Arcticibacter tournemirensis]
MEQKVELRKVRDFGELINDTFVFTKQNWKPLLKAYFTICGFFLAAAVIVAVLQQQRLLQAFGSLPTGASPFTVYGWDTVINVVLVMLFYVMMTLTTFSYMSLYKEKGNTAPSVEEVWGYVRYFFGRMFVAQILLSILIIIGFVCCFIPGVYLMPVTAIMLASIVFENSSLGYSFDRGFKLIKGQWWTTFGAMLVMMVVYYAVSIVLVLPISLITGAGVFLGRFNMPFPFLAATVVLQYLAQVFMILLYLLTGIAYFSLAEEKDGAGLSERISSIGKSDPSADLPEEQY